MSNPAIQNNVNDIKNNVVNIWNILFVFNEISLEFYSTSWSNIYIFLSYFLSRLWHFFFIGSHTHIHFLEMKYYFSFILTRGEIRFKLFIHYKTFKKKKKRNRISSKNRIIFFHSTKPLWPFIWLDEKYYLSLRISNTENATKKTYPFEIENFIDVIPRRIFRTKKYRNISQKRF